MSERPSPGDWERWQAEWQGGGARGPGSEDARRQIGAARRALLATRLIESAVAGSAILVTAAALWHAGNAWEATLGLVVGSSIAALWIQRLRLRAPEERGAAAASAEYLGALEAARTNEVRLAHFIWVVLPLELAFLIPWWVTGTRVHHRALTDPGSWETVWAPMLGMLALLVWSWRLWRRARAELGVIERLREQYRNGGA